MESKNPISICYVNYQLFIPWITDCECFEYIFVRYYSNLSMYVITHLLCEVGLTKRIPFYVWIYQCHLLLGQLLWQGIKTFQKKVFILNLWHLLYNLYSLYILQHCKMSVKPMAGFDMENRDPNNLNEHLQVCWKYENCFQIKDLRFHWDSSNYNCNWSNSVQFRWCGMI